MKMMMIVVVVVLMMMMMMMMMTGWTCVSILRLSDLASLVCNSYLSVAACFIV